MSNWIERLKEKGNQEMDPDLNLALRELAGWPLQSHNEAGHRHIHRTTVIYRDALGRVTHSVEQIDEDGYEEYLDTWGK